VIGSSTFPPELIVEAQWAAERRATEPFSCEQPPYSLFTRGIEAGVLPTCQRYGMGVIAWSPLGGGWLTGKYRKDKEIDMTSGRAARLAETASIPRCPATSPSSISSRSWRRWPERRAYRSRTSPSPL